MLSRSHERATKNMYEKNQVFGRRREREGGVRREPSSVCREREKLFVVFALSHPDIRFACYP